MLSDPYSKMYEPLSGENKSFTLMHDAWLKRFQLYSRFEVAGLSALTQYWTDFDC